jgi:hypothetical protein
LVISGSLGIVARATLVREDRLAWSMIGAGCLAWAGGDIYWWRVLSQVEEIPYPSVADGFYLLFYPLIYIGLGLLVRRRLRHFQDSQWLDGLSRRASSWAPPGSPWCFQESSPRPAAISRSPRRTSPTRSVSS